MLLSLQRNFGAEVQSCVYLSILLIFILYVKNNHNLVCKTLTLAGRSHEKPLRIEYDWQ